MKYILCCENRSQKSYGIDVLLQNVGEKGSMKKIFEKNVRDFSVTADLRGKTRD